MAKRILKITGIVLLIFLFTTIIIYFKFIRPKPLPISDADRAALQIMPLPAALKLSDGKFLLNGDFGAELTGPEDSIVIRAVGRLIRRTSKETNLPLKGKGTGLTIIYETATKEVQPVETDESYRISIHQKGILLKASSGYGVLHGLESLSQLLKKVKEQYDWQEMEISDAPRFAWRGLMIDVCRHWIPKEVILRNLDAMSALKLNVLHLHLSDHQGFRVESKTFPKLQELGSGGNYYTQEDIREIVGYARDRGIRIVPEFDMPGHMISFLVGYPELASAPGPYHLETSFMLVKPVLDPTRDEVYNFLDSFIAEMARLFPDPCFHIGGDEVDYTPWEKNQAIQMFMKQNAIGNAHDLQSYFNQRLEKILQKQGKKMVGWDEILNPNLSREIVVQSWRSQKSLFVAAQEGRKAILSAGYYLDHKLSAARHYGVDPVVLPGAVTIKPDSLHWQQFDLSVFVSETPLKTSLVLYGEKDKLRGLFFMMDNAVSFDEAIRNGNELNFSFKSDFGKIDLKSVFIGDSLSGKMSLGILSFPFRGKKTGGDDMAGTRPPTVEQMKPLTPEQKSNILGGEAAMWTEVVGAQNIDSRIWPRMAAMAEKWWSPQELTKDVNNMYRRLGGISLYLDKMGLRHLKGKEELMADLAGGKDIRPVKCLIDVLEEVKYTGRLLNANTLMPLNEAVDACDPESMTAVKFQQLTDGFIADIEHRKNEREIRQWLTAWRDNHKDFEKVAAGNPRLEKILPTSRELSDFSGFALNAMDELTGKSRPGTAGKKTMLETMKGVAESRAGTLLAVLPSLKKLVEAMP